MATKTRPPQETLTPGELVALFAELENKHPRVAMAAQLMALAGLRVGEARLAEWGWIENLAGDRPLLHIPAEVTKTKLARTIPIAIPLRLALQRQERRQHLTPPAVIPPGWPLVLNRWGKAPSRRYIAYALKYASLKSIGRPVRTHTLRHTFATQLLRFTNTRVVQLALGHRSIHSTEAYTHPNLADLREAMDRATYLIDTKWFHDLVTPHKETLT
jgi:integrase